ncbi:DUF2933 domain-containing protein [Rhizobium sp. 3T7]|uniref:DUF2933 domain-containing protein n=1 Tax=Rhizobium sp. 3T7 TaxID=2874922 RepID=UPI001CCEE4FB|nr:DUF2933 domain-containing protein [Rhizobium sp. 3T7]MBZ9790969.1 DUF2933 domain-containing protein [Rhizobium sp. 3T7]
MKWDRRWTLLVASFGVIVAFFFLREHWAHALGLLPYLLLLACPLMHLFHGHGSHQTSPRDHHNHRDGPS